MINLRKTQDTDTIKEFRAELYKSFTAPIDAMWEQLHIGSSQHHLVEYESKNIGYCCIDDKDSLLQIFLCKEYNYLMDRILSSLIESKLIRSASLSAIEPISFNACLFHSKSIKTNTFCFQYSYKTQGNESPLNIELVTKSDIPAIKVFLMEQIGFDDNFGYTENLVKRREFYMIKESDIIVATSECRLSDSQPNVADLGVIVNKDYQGKGLAARILHQQAKNAQKLNRNPVCSTTFDNIASRKAIENAGFYCSNIIFDMNFISNGKRDDK